jgi:hypothetical protein
MDWGRTLAEEAIQYSEGNMIANGFMFVHFQQIAVNPVMGAQLNEYVSIT